MSTRLAARREQRREHRTSNEQPERYQPSWRLPDSAIARVAEEPCAGIWRGSEGAEPRADRLFVVQACAAVKRYDSLSSTQSFRSLCECDRVGGRGSAPGQASTSISVPTVSNL
jgi:hypothetical protein